MSSVFSHFLSERSFKSRQNPRVDFFQARKDFEGFKTAFFHLLLLSFVVDGRGHFVNSAFRNKKHLAQNEVYL